MHSVEAMLREDDTTSLRVFRAGFVPPLVDDYDSYMFVAQQTPVDNDSLFSSVSFALTGQWGTITHSGYYAKCIYDP